MELQEVTTINLGQELTHKTVMLYKPMFERYIPGITDTLTIGCRDLKVLDGSGLALLAWAFMKLGIDKKRLILHNVKGQPLAILTHLDVIEILKGEEP